MTLKFSCPHCRKGIRVKEELAGKKAKCPACQQVLTIPAVKGATPPPATKSSTDSDLEAKALAALVEQTKSPGSTPVSTKTIDFQCPFCDEKIRLSADLAGKRAPCPECSRIVKVPLPEDSQPKDWRKVDVRSPITRDHKGEPAPEGAWGSEVSRGRVSRQALLEAGALPVVKEKWTLRQWANRIALAVIVVFGVVVSAWAILHYSFESRKGGAFSQAEKLVAETKDPLTAAEVYRGLGVYQFRAEKPVGENNSAKAALNQFLKARAKLSEEGRESAERDAILIDLALDQADLGSDSQEAQKRGIRLNWDETVKEVHRTLQHIKSPEARLQGLRLVERKFLDLNLPNIAARLPDAILDPNDPNRAEALAQYGLLIIDQKEQANAQATQALQAFTPLKKNPKATQESFPPSLVALLVALDRKDLKELPETPPKENPPLDLRVGFTWAWAYRGQLGEARSLALSSGPASHQLHALIALIAALVEKKADIGVDLAAAIERVEPALKEKDTNVSHWTLYRLVQLGARGGKPDQVAKVVPFIPDAELRGLADLEITLATLPSHSPDEMWNDLATHKPPCRHALLVLARHNTRFGSSSFVSKAVNSWEPELRPLGYAGIALGMQDAER
jgi:hypothetical protein